MIKMSVECLSLIQRCPMNENMSFRLKNDQKLSLFWHQIGFQDLKDVSLGAMESLKVTLGNISHGMSHRNGFTGSGAYKLGLKS